MFFSLKLNVLNLFTLVNQYIKSKSSKYNVTYYDSKYNKDLGNILFLDLKVMGPDGEFYGQLSDEVKIYVDKLNKEEIVFHGCNVEDMNDYYNYGEMDII